MHQILLYSSFYSICWVLKWYFLTGHASKSRGLIANSMLNAFENCYSIHEFYWKKYTFLQFGVHNIKKKYWANIGLVWRMNFLVFYFLLSNSKRRSANFALFTHFLQNWFSSLSYSSLFLYMSSEKPLTDLFHTHFQNQSAIWILSWISSYCHKDLILKYLIWLRQSVKWLQVPGPMSNESPCYDFQDPL